MKSIEAKPNDKDLRAVYADWLEEHDDLLRAEFIRLLLDASQFEWGSTERPVIEERLQTLRARLDDEWLTLVDPHFKVIRVNELLYEMAEANAGSDHGCGYSLDVLSKADSLRTALEKHFAQFGTYNPTVQPPYDWNIQYTKVTRSDAVLRDTAMHWFYEQPFSPGDEIAIRNKTVAEFLDRLYAAVGQAQVFEVEVTPPMWYDCEWQDFAFENGDQRWFLHLGYSD